MKRSDDRKANELRKLEFVRGFTDNPAGSVLVTAGGTRLLCTASVEKGVPSFLEGKHRGWVTSEYNMVPGSTSPRKMRDSRRSYPDGRTIEIQRIIGRSLRSAIDTRKLPEVTVWLDCEVLDADGGTRTAAVNGAYVALVDAMEKLRSDGALSESPIRHAVAAVSVGIVRGCKLLDLDYSEDASAEVDMNVVMTERGDLVEVGASAELKTFNKKDLNELLDLAQEGISTVLNIQKKALER